MFASIHGVEGWTSCFNIMILETQVLRWSRLGVVESETASRFFADQHQSCR